MKRYHPLLVLAATAALATMTAISARPARAQEAEADAERRIACGEQRLARAAVRAAQRATARAVASLPPGAMLTRRSLVFVDGPEVPLDWIEWADDIGSRRVRREMVT